MISRSTKPQTAESVYPYALRLLAARDYSLARMRAKILAQGVAEDDAETVLDRLQREGWLNDRRYAERFAEIALTNGRFYGSRLKMEMRRRGLESELVDDVLSALQEEFDETSELEAMVRRHSPGFSFSSATDREKRRIIAYLQRRGFGLSTILKVLRSAEQ